MSPDDGSPVIETERVEDTVTVTVAVACSPTLSVAVTVAVYVPAAA